MFGKILLKNKYIRCLYVIIMHENIFNNKFLNYFYYIKMPIFADNASHCVLEYKANLETHFQQVSSLFMCLWCYLTNDL